MNNNCQQFEFSLDAFHDGELTKDERAQVESHLVVCPSCTEKLSEISRVVHSLQALPDVLLPDSLSAKLDDLAQRKAVSNTFSSKYLLVAGAAAVLVLVLGLRGPYLSDLQYKLAATEAGQNQDNREQISQGPEPVKLSTPVNRGSVNQEQVGGPEIVGRPDAIAVTPRTSGDLAPKGGAHKIADGYEFDYEHLAMLSDYSDTYTDEAGLAVDEDGLYDIKM